ncbi:MAG: hypothetical protein RI890_1275, partial [Actinomycetota bacterium]
VVNREESRDVSAWAVDIDVDVLVRVFTLKVNQLRTNQIRDRVVNRRSKNDDVLFEQATVKVIDALATAGLLGDVWNVIVANKIHERNTSCLGVNY